MASIFASAENFEDIEPLVSEVHFEPLVPPEQYQRHVDYTRKKQDRKAWVSGAVDIAMYRHITWQSGAQNSADYMLAARRVYAEGKPTAAMAEELGLDLAVLEDWVTYLEPGDTLRLYLLPWYEAAPEDIEGLAEQYEQRFLTRGRSEIAKLECWLEEALAAIQSDADLPDRDRFTPSKDRLFAEVALPGGEMGEGGAEINGPFSIPKKQREELLDAASKQLIEELRSQIEELECEAPPEPDMAYAVREAESVEQHVFVRGQPFESWRGSAEGVSDCHRWGAAAQNHERQRPSGAGSVACEPRPSADKPCCSQSHLALALFRRPGPDPK